MMNVLWRFILTLIFLTSLSLILAIAWDVPKYIGYELPGDFSRLPQTILILLAMISGVWGTWTRGGKEVKKDITIPKPMIVPKEDIFSVPPPTSGELSPIEQANQAKK